MTSAQHDARPADTTSPVRWRPRTPDGARPCSIADTLTLVGEKWSLLVVREVIYGMHRFDEIQRGTGAPRDILTARLKRLVEAGVLYREPYQQRPTRYDYLLTRAGQDLGPVLLHLKAWGDRYLAPGHYGRPPVSFIHDCGQVFEPETGCSDCGRTVHLDSLSLGSAVSQDAAASPAARPVDSDPGRAARTTIDEP